MKIKLSEEVYEKTGYICEDVPVGFACDMWKPIVTHSECPIVISIIRDLKGVYNLEGEVMTTLEEYENDLERIGKSGVPIDDIHHWDIKDPDQKFTDCVKHIHLKEVTSDKDDFYDKLRGLLRNLRR